MTIGVGGYYIHTKNIREITDIILVRYIQLAEKLNLEEVRKTCIETLARVKQSYIDEKDDVFNLLSLETRHGILQQRVRLLETPGTRSECLMLGPPEHQTEDKQAIWKFSYRPNKF